MKTFKKPQVAFDDENAEKFWSARMRTYADAASTNTRVHDCICKRFH